MKQFIVWLAVLTVAAAAIIAVAGAGNAGAARLETPQFTPVSYWISPIQLSEKSGFYVDFDVYMASTTASHQTHAVALLFASCNGTSFRLHKRTRHLANGEQLAGIAGGPDGPTRMLWSRSMGVPPAAHAVKLHLSFVANQSSGSFCMRIWDAASLDGGSYLTIELAMH